jgi:hypothetical protein
LNTHVFSIGADDDALLLGFDVADDLPGFDPNGQTICRALPLAVDCEKNDAKT